MAKVEEVLADDPDLEHFTAYTGAGAPRFYMALNPDLPNDNASPLYQPHKRKAPGEVCLMPRKVRRDARCSQCGGKLGLGVRARNLWNGCWWVRLRFCSLRCDGLYRLGRHEGDDPNLLVRGHPQS